jgi:hypothetical protein
MFTPGEGVTISPEHPHLPGRGAEVVADDGGATVLVNYYGDHVGPMGKPVPHPPTQYRVPRAQLAGTGQPSVGRQVWDAHQHDVAVRLEWLEGTAARCRWERGQLLRQGRNV